MSAINVAAIEAYLIGSGAIRGMTREGKVMPPHLKPDEWRDYVRTFFDHDYRTGTDAYSMCDADGDCWIVMDIIVPPGGSCIAWPEHLYDHEALLSVLRIAGSHVEIHDRRKEVINYDD